MEMKRQGILVSKIHTIYMRLATLEQKNIVLKCDTRFVPVYCLLRPLSIASRYQTKAVHIII
jgi:hypothetical protein